MSYQALCTQHEELSILRSTAATIGWDQEAIMPKKAVGYRAKQLSYLSGKIHSMATSADYANLLLNAEEEPPSCLTAQANIREWRHHFDRATKLPSELVQKASKTSSLGKAAWAEAREKSDFSIFAPLLTELLAIAREKAELWGYEDEPYSALLSGFERGANTSTVASIFDSCRTDLIETAAAATAKSATEPSRQLTGEFCIENQKILGQEVAASIGFDFDAGRLDTTTHPFCSSIAPQDTRLTTRYYKDNFFPSLFGTMHEAGHGLYEQGLDKEQYGRPAGESVSLGIHESQSLLWENHIGRSRAFWTQWLPRTQELFPQLSDWSIDDILAHINTAKYSYVRVDADEATYDLHILLRFALERRMLNGEIEVKDIPATWNESFKEMFGMTPESHSQGCLQDIHWSMGAIGYFPTYSLGNFNASQLFHHAKLDSKVAAGCEVANYKPLLQWMQTNIHAKGSTLLPQEILKQTTGEGTNPAYHLAHLKRRFL